MQWRSFLLFREDAHKGWNGYVAAHWQKAQEAEPTLTFTPWRGGTYPTTTLPAHVAGKAMARQGRFDAFHLGAMRAFCVRLRPRSGRTSTALTRTLLIPS